MMLATGPILTRRVIGFLSEFLFSVIFLTSCLGQGTDQLHGMYDLVFPSTAVCNSQEKIVPFRNTSSQETIIEGVAISVGTDPLGNFSLQAILIGSEEQPSINGVLQDIHIPAGTNYSFKLSYTPKTENEDHEAILDIAFKEPQAGIVQIDLQGVSAGKSPACPDSGGGTGGGDDGGSGGDDGSGGGDTGGDDGGNGGDDGSGGGDTGGDDGGSGGDGTGGGSGGNGGGDGGGTDDGAEDSGKVMIETVERIIAATSALGSPINSDQGKEDFRPVDLELILDGDAGTVTLAPFTEETFILPPPESNVPGIGGLIRGNTIITIPQGASGTYNESTGLIDIPQVTIHMDSIQDFTADIVTRLTTERIVLGSVSPSVNRDALRTFGTPLHYDSVRREIFGSRINSQTGKIFLVGVAKLTNVQLQPPSTGRRPELDQLPQASMALLIEGIVREKE